MASLSADRNTPRRNKQEFYYPVAASTKLYKGQPVCLDSAGNLVAASLTTGLISVGILESDADNSAGIAAAISAPVMAGCFRLDNYGSITKSSIGDVVYFYDNTSVQASGTSASAAGVLVDVDSFGCWVQLGPIEVANSAGALLAANNLSDVGTNLTALNTLLGGTANLVAAANSVDRKDAGALAVGAVHATSVVLGTAATPVTVSSAGSLAATTTLIGARLLQTKTATYTVQTPAIDGGCVIQDLTDGAVITLPASVAANKGMVVTLQNTATSAQAGIQFTLNAADALVGTIVGVSVTKAAGAATLTNTKATAAKGDYATVVSNGAGAWYVIGGVGVWA